MILNTINVEFKNTAALYLVVLSLFEFNICNFDKEFWNGALQTSDKQR